MRSEKGDKSFQLINKARGRHTQVSYPVQEVRRSRKGIGQMTEYQDYEQVF